MAEDFATPVLNVENLKKLDKMANEIISELDLPESDADWTEEQHSKYFETCRGRAYENGLGGQFDLLIFTLGQEQIAAESEKSRIVGPDDSN